MVDSTLGYAVGTSGTILKTTDGSTWDTLTRPTTNSLYAVYFLDANTGFICGDLIKL